MRTWRIQPAAPALAPYIESYWFLQKAHGEVEIDQPLLNPDPHAHLIVAAETQSYRYDAGASAHVGTGNHLILPHREAFRLHHRQALALLGIKLHIGGVYAFAHRLADGRPGSVVSIAPLPNSDSSEPAETELLQMATQGAAKTRDLLDTRLQTWLLPAREDQHSRLTQSILPFLATHKISDIGSLLGRSQRSLERSFLRVTGLTMKQCQAMSRFDELFEHVHRLGDSHVQWAHIGHQFGFSDQPHLIREMRKSIGKTPRQYERCRDLTVDAYGRFEHS